MPPTGRRFQPGQSGNPAGRPKSKPLSDELKRLLAEPHEGSAHTNAHMVAWTMIQMAIKGRVDAARLVWEYVEGKPVQRVEFDLQAAAEAIAKERGLESAQVYDLAQRLAARQAG